MIICHLLFHINVMLLEDEAVGHLSITYPWDNYIFQYTAVLPTVSTLLGNIKAWILKAPNFIN